MKKILLNTLFTLVSFFSFSQTVYRFDVNPDNQNIKSGHLKMGNPGDPAILINSRYMTIGDKPVIPVMGEIHYSRVNRDRWEEMLLKMKANGINIIASYILWIHHEEIEGELNWSGNKDLRTFVELCQKHDLLFVARVGPWCHAEVRNGGTPDWILNNPNVKDRSNDPNYQTYAKKWFAEIANQLDGLYYKNGGPIMAVQLENEYRRGPGGDAHILWLKQTAQELGMDVPMYTVTGWGPASVPENEVIPLYGGYPTSPWTTDLGPVDKSNNFSFETAVNDPTIGGESGNTSLPKVDLTGYPYFTCELGIGNQISYHRRPIINPLDGVTISMAKVGSGSNLPGYYVFTGGSNPKGILTSLEEDQRETGYWNRYPKVSYDFQAAIKETGELAQSYHEIKAFHYFLNAFGDQLAPMQPFIHEHSNKAGLQVSLRADKQSGFLFGLNYLRNRKSESIATTKFEVGIRNEKIIFPEVKIPANCNFVWPINLIMDDRILKYATCQPVGRVTTKKSTLWVFKQNEDIPPQLSFDKPLDDAKTNYTIDPSIDKTISWTNAEGIKNYVLVVPEHLNDQIWIINNHLYITDADIYENNEELVILTKQKEGTIYTFGTQLGLKKSKQKGLLNQYTFKNDIIKPTVSINIKQLFTESQWLKTNVDKVSPKNELYHRFFRKTFELDNTAQIENAQLVYYSSQPFRIRVNKRWVNQPTQSEERKSLDLTGYLNLGANEILLDFDFHDNVSAFVGELRINYYNTDQLIIPSDTTWRVASSYTIPKAGYKMRRADVPEIIEQDTSLASPTTSYQLDLSYSKVSNLNALLLNIDYAGDRAEMYQNGNLIADNFNNGTTWSTNVLDRCNPADQQPLNIEISPLNNEYKIFFDRTPETGKASIVKVELVPEYKTQINLK
jgi:hypothetical protein